MKKTWLVVLAAAALLAPEAFSAARWEGRWRLVVQTYGAGASNLAPEDVPVRLELAEVSGLPAGRVWAGDDERSAVPWPAFGSGPALVEARRISRDATAVGAIEARYRVRPVATDDLVLLIREAYAPSADGAWLEGTVEVRFEGGTVNRGGYALHRRYARER
jgi:hypothetical protein